MKIKKLRYFRVIQGFSQDQVAAAADVTQAKISRAERGYGRLSSEEREKIAGFLGCQPDELFD